MSRLCFADRLLALEALQRGVEAGADAGSVARVWDLIKQADRMAAGGEPVAAIDQYRNAWHHSALLRLCLKTEFAQGSLALQFASVPGNGFEVETSTNLIDWTPIGGGVADPEGMARFGPIPDLGTNPHFFRVKVVEQ